MILSFHLFFDDPCLYDYFICNVGFLISRAVFSYLLNKFFSYVVLVDFKKHKDRTLLHSEWRFRGQRREGGKKVI